MKGIVYLAGAGCVTREWCTFAVNRALEQADAIVYDDLLPEGLIDQLPKRVQQYYVGKRGGQYHTDQKQIETLLVQLAQEGKTVVRLKGGDPLVFGRGGEEALALQKAHIPYVLIPGITSALALPEKWGIPLTHRKESRSFHVYTGHTAEGTNGVPDSLVQAAKLEGNLVFLMALSNLKRIVETLIEQGRDPDTPTAVLGTEAVRAPLREIAEAASKVQGPAVVVIGPGAGRDLRSPDLPLRGACVGLTGTAGWQHKLRPILESWGAEVVSVQKTEVQRVMASEAFATCLQSRPDWIGLTSPHGAQEFVSLLKQIRMDVRQLAGIRLAAVGRATARVLAEHGFYADCVALAQTTEDLGRALTAEVHSGERVLMMGADNASREPDRILMEAGVECQREILYEAKPSGLLDSEKAFDILCFGSAAAVEAYAREGGKPPRKRVVAIGKQTAAAIDKQNWAVEIQIASYPSAEAVLACFADLQPEPEVQR